MFRFEYPDHLYALLLIPLLIGFFIAMSYLRKRAIERFGTSSLLVQLMPGVSKYKHAVKFTLLTVALAFLIVAWANPQFGTKVQKIDQKSADVFIALDVSRSMWTEDIAPSRMDRASRFTQNLIESLAGERIGLILFAGNAYMQMPLTTDYSAALLFAKSANPDLAPAQGTSIAEAIQLAQRSFDEKNKNYKALVLITDGEDHEGEAITLAEEANADGLLIFTIGVGTANGSLIPTTVNGYTDYLRDNSGNPVRSALNENLLREIAQAGDGAYFNLSAGEEAIVNAIQNGIDQLEKQEMEQRVFDEYNSWFQLPLGIALVLIIIEFFISYRKSRLLEGRDLFS